MEARATTTPAFGKADLSNCEREQIHLAGSIQPHGALLLLREPDLSIVQASANAWGFLGANGPLLGRTLSSLGGNIADRVKPLLGAPLHIVPTAVRCRLGDPAADFDVLVHRPSDGGLIVELERAGPAVDLSNKLDSYFQPIVVASSLRQLCDETSRIFRDLTGYDRVMVYRFDDDGHGEVYSEQCRAELEPYLGNRYPASDIPQIARRLYERNRVRVLSDVHYTPVPLTPRLSPLTGNDLDMSLCFLRSSSPIHVQYLKNMGVAATLVVSLVVCGKLWGLVACHHYEPRFVHFEARALCEVLAEMAATRIAALESFTQAQAELAMRRLEQRMVESISREGDWRAALFDGSQSLLAPFGASGAALLFEGQVLTVGEVPATQDLREIGDWLDSKPRDRVFSTMNLSREGTLFESLGSVASGLLATPVSSSLGEYLVWFRPERVRTVTWGGNPFAPVLVGNDPSELSPRRSFAQWHQIVEGTSEPWSKADTTAAHLLGETLRDVILQFRSVRMLIAQDHLESVRQQVRVSEQPVIVANAAGRILLTNEAFERLLQSTHAHVQWLEDLAPFFSQSTEVRRRLQELLRRRIAWRGEVQLETAAATSRHLSVRADPVFSSPNRVLGFVVILTDMTEAKSVEIARRRLQQGIVEGRQVMMRRMDSQADPIFQHLLSSVIENAQLAALEINDGMDMSRMPEMLESVRASVARTSEVLEHLISHATDASKDS